MPRNERSFTAAQSQLQSAQAGVSRDLASEADLFRALPSARQYPDRLGRAAASLAAAGQSLAELEQLQKQNRRSDRDRAESLLAREKQARTAAVTDAESVRKEAAHWVDLKQHLPQEVQDMERDYKAIQAVDLAGASAAVQKAEADWPEKKGDLDSRLASARAIQTSSDATLAIHHRGRAAPPLPTITPRSISARSSRRPIRSKPAPPHCPNKPNSSKP